MGKIAVFGANGYIARNLIYVLKRDYPQYELSLYGIEDTYVDGSGKYVSVDMTDGESMKKIDLDVDVIFMLVGKTGSVNGFDQYDSFIDINVRALLDLLNEYRNQGSIA